MHVEWKDVTGNPSVTRKLTEFAKMCCAYNTSKLRTSVTAVMFFHCVYNNDNGNKDDDKCETKIPVLTEKSLMCDMCRLTAVCKMFNYRHLASMTRL